jgi:hypothetical protein
VVDLPVRRLDHKADPADRLRSRDGPAADGALDRRWEAARLGLVNRLVPRSELMGWAIETAEMIAANSPSAVQAVKRQVTATIADHALTLEALEQQLGDGTHWRRKPDSNHRSRVTRPSFRRRLMSLA